jgi:hypothetical protein
VVLEATKMLFKLLNLAGIGKDTWVAVVAATAALLVYDLYDGRTICIGLDEPDLMAETALSGSSKNSPQ